MKYLLALVVLSLHAAPIGNPSLPALIEEGFFISDQFWTNPQVGFNGDFLFQKRLRACHASHRLGLRQASLWGTSQVGIAAWNVRDRFLFQIEAGSGQFHWRWQQAGQNVTGQSKGGVVWSGDAKLIILDMKDTTLAADAHVGGWDWMEGSALANGAPLLETTHSHLRYWQLALALTQKISFFAPYVGIAANRTRFKVSHLSTGTGWTHAKHTLGPFVGCSFSTGKPLLVNLEWRGLFEEGLSLSAHVRF